jgi:four helix bundle protein
MSSNYQDLRVWQQASVASNIAEGKGHRSDREFLHFLYHARGSLFQLETQILLAHQLQYISETETADLRQLITPVARSLTGLINSLEQQAAVATTV